MDSADESKEDSRMLQRNSKSTREEGPLHARAGRSEAAPGGARLAPRGGRAGGPGSRRGLSSR